MAIGPDVLIPPTGALTAHRPRAPSSPRGISFTHSRSPRLVLPAPDPPGPTNRMNRPKIPRRDRAGSDLSWHATGPHADNFLPRRSLTARTAAPVQRYLRIMPQRSAAGPMLNQAPDQLLLRDIDGCHGKRTCSVTHTWPQNPFQISASWFQPTNDAGGQAIIADASAAKKKVRNHRTPRKGIRPPR